MKSKEGLVARNVRIKHKRVRGIAVLLIIPLGAVAWCIGWGLQSIAQVKEKLKFANPTRINAVQTAKRKQVLRA